MVGSWKMEQSTYFSILGVASPGPISGRSLCMTIEAGGAFTARMAEGGVDSGFRPCGVHATCTLTGHIDPDDKKWLFTEEAFSCRMRRKVPNSYRGTMKLEGKILALAFEGLGMWGSLQGFGLVRGDCQKPFPANHPPCSSGSPSAFDTGL
jgi:hypothetical protein